MRTRHEPSLPPYEVMRKVGSPTTASSDHNDVEPSHPDAARFIAAMRHPIVFRVPRGYVPLFIAAFLGLLLLSYWIGTSRGYRRAADKNQPDLSRRMVAPTMTSFTPGGSMVTQAPDRPDPRQHGYSYFVLAEYPEAEAQRLVQFLREHEVDADGFWRHNARLVRVIALHGFSPDEIDSTARAKFEKQLRRLGRLWKDKGRGAASLHQLSLERYDGNRK